jgi:hypothetical protein
MNLKFFRIHYIIIIQYNIIMDNSSQEYANALQSALEDHAADVEAINTVNTRIDEQKSELQEGLLPTSEVFLKEYLGKSVSNIAERFGGQTAKNAVEDFNEGGISKVAEGLKTTARNAVNKALNTAKNQTKPLTDEEDVEPIEEEDIQPVESPSVASNIQETNIDNISQEDALQMIRSQEQIRPTAEDLPEGSGAIQEEGDTLEQPDMSGEVEQMTEGDPEADIGADVGETVGEEGADIGAEIGTEAAVEGAGLALDATPLAPIGVLLAVGGLLAGIFGGGSHESAPQITYSPSVQMGA